MTFASWLPLGADGFSETWWVAFFRQASGSVPWVLPSRIRVGFSGPSDEEGAIGSISSVVVGNGFLPDASLERPGVITKFVKATEMPRRRRRHRL